MTKIKKMFTLDLLLCRWVLCLIVEVGLLGLLNGLYMLSLGLLLVLMGRVALIDVEISELSSARLHL